MRSPLRLRELDEWWRQTLTDKHQPISIAGEFRLKGQRRPLELIELGGASAHTVKVLLPRRAPVSRAHESATGDFYAGGDWWNTWGPIFVSAGMLAPIVDPLRLLDLLHDSRRIRFCCDTNALAGGVISWLLMALGARVDIVTSAVVDRELAAWPDRAGSTFWTAKDVRAWQLRTHYRLARRIIECPPDGVVIDRLSPEQGALMLAKRRDENDENKSPDADVLLVEVARALVRDQPRNARIVFLTGDRNNARTATGALGAENVLFAVADDHRARQQPGKVLARGFYRPDGPLGAVQVPPIRSLIWTLLAACDRLHVKRQDAHWILGVKSNVGSGAPSDWADPWLEIDETSTRSLAPAVQARAIEQSIVPSEPQVVEEANASASSFEGPLERANTELAHTPGSKMDSQATSPQSSSCAFELQYTAQEPIRNSQEPIGSSDTHDDWLLEPKHLGARVDVPSGARPMPNIVFPILVQAFGKNNSLAEHGSKETRREALRILSALGATDDVGKPGPRIEEFRDAWQKRDYDWYHAEMSRLPGYADVLSKLREEGDLGLSAREQAQVSMARALGQVARMESSLDSVLFLLSSDSLRVKTRRWLLVGDYPVKVAQVIDALRRWFPNPKLTRGTEELCQAAALELNLTPLRFERAMERLWHRGLGACYTQETGGTVEGGPSEKVIEMGTSEIRFRNVAPGDLSFGRSGPVRFVTRTK